MPRPFTVYNGIRYPIYYSGYGYGYAGFGWSLGFNYGYPYYPYDWYYGPWYSRWYPYGWSYPFGYYGGGVAYERDDPDYGGSSSPKHEMGSLRIKASPNHAKVYVDGTLMGLVDDFDGLTHHLDLEPGTHRVELRADGYVTAAQDVTVTTGTTTLRMSLKKK